MKIIKTIALVLAVIMLMSCYTFAYVYGCTCTNTYSAAFSQGDNPEANSISASFSGMIRIIGGTWYPVSGSSTASGSYTSCEDDYYMASRGSINSSHYIDGNSYHDSDSFK